VTSLLIEKDKQALGDFYKKNKHKKVRIPRHRIAELILHHEGKPLCLDKYKLFYPLYDLECDEVIYITGRQVAKTTTLSATEVLSVVFKPHYKVLYIAPLQEQVKRFSRLYVEPLMTQSPMIKRLTDHGSTQNVFCRTLKNGSRIEFCYVSNTVGNVERVRGISSDELNLDEYQDIPDEAMYIAEMCISASDYGYMKYCGTPKTIENPMERMFRRSNQHEYIIKCSGCNHHNIPISPDIWKMVGPTGPICSKCGELLDIENAGEWVKSAPDVEHFYGFHIPQIIVPRNLKPARWRKLYKQFVYWPKKKVANEIFGLSFDSGGKPITLTELRKLKQISEDQKFDRNKYKMTVAGVDWTGCGTKETSLTALVILGVNFDGKCDVVMYKKWVDPDTVEQAKEIAKLLNEWNVTFCGCDNGVGHTNNILLTQFWSPNRKDKVLEFFYTGPNSRLLAWNKSRFMYMLSKTRGLNLLFLDMKKQKVFFKNEERTEREIFKDILAVYEDMTESPSGETKVYKRLLSQSDDLLHALHFAYITAQRAVGKLLIDYSDEDTDEL
jgi:hypothetical protein